MSRKSLLRRIAVVTLSCIMGCGGSAEGPPKVEINGKVSHNGKPIDKGDIAFYPEGSTTGSPTSGPIIDGAYKLTGPAAIAAGNYRVEVMQYRSPTAAIKDTSGLQPSDAMIPQEQILPEKFNKKSTIEKLTVSDMSKKITKDYDLKD